MTKEARSTNDEGHPSAYFWDLGIRASFVIRH